MESQTTQIFEHLNMLSEGAGLFCVDEQKRSNDEQKSIEEHPWAPRLKRYLHEAGEYGASWVYFRLYSQSGAPRPEIFIFDQAENLASAPSSVELAELHKQLWNYGNVPLVFVLKSTGVDVFNMLVKPVLDENGEPLPPEILETLDLSVADKLSLAGASIKGTKKKKIDSWKRFDSAHFDNGYFWEMSDNKSLGNANDAALSSLVGEMKTARELIENQISNVFDKTERNDLVRRLLIVILMIRFLEERGILPDDYFSELSNDGLLGVLHSSELILKALDKLTNDFNGDVFYVEESIRKSIKKLSAENLVAFANFADNSSIGNQRCFWKLYSFKDLPVEVISYVYEDFLGGKSQSYYTPHHLVNLMLDEAMPPSRTIEKIKSSKFQKSFSILDPSCGSGVFLVGAWERLLEAYLNTSDQISPRDLKDLMVENIYGVDIEKHSIELSIFSLSVALCSSFQSKKENKYFLFEQLKELKFPNLKGINLHKGDFFQVRKDLIKSDLRFDLIVGNPPFEEGFSTQDQKDFDLKRTDEDGKLWTKTPGSNLAYLFLRAVLPLLKEGAKSCIVQPHGVLYNKGSHELQKSLFQNWKVREILDFVSIPKLFCSRSGGTAPNAHAVSILIEKEEPTFEKPLLHITFRNVSLLEQRRFFEIDPQDLHWTAWDTIFHEPKVWAANFLGGGRTLETYKKFIRGISFKDQMKLYEKERSWFYREGLIVGDPAKYKKETEEGNNKETLKHRPKYSKWDLLETESLAGDRVDFSEVKLFKREWLLRPRNKELFFPPHILMKKSPDLPLAIRKDGEPLLFKDRIVGISAPPEDIELLEKVYIFLIQSKPYIPFFAAFGAEYLLGRKNALQKKDLDLMPYVEDFESEIKGINKHIFDDVVDFMVPSIIGNQTIKNSLRQNAKRQLVKSYASTFLTLMNTVYRTLHHTETIDLDSAWCVTFSLSKNLTKFGSTTQIREYLDNLLINDQGKSLRCMRIVRHFNGESIFILKPKAKKYWLKSVAIRDADEMFISAVESAQKDNLALK